MQSQESQNSLEEEEIDNSNQSQEPGFRYADQEDGLPELKEANPRVEDIFEPDDMEKLVINE